MRPRTEMADSNSTIASLLDACPNAAEVLLRHGMACVGCTMAPFETLAEAAREYRVDLKLLSREIGIRSVSLPRRQRRGFHQARDQSEPQRSTRAAEP